MTGSELLSCCFEELYRHLFVPRCKYIRNMKMNCYFLAEIKVQLLHVSKVIEYGSSYDRQANNNDSVENFSHVYRLKIVLH